VEAYFELRTTLSAYAAAAARIPRFANACSLSKMMSLIAAAPDVTSSDSRILYGDVKFEALSRGLLAG
jgi:hypothetical protein